MEYTGGDLNADVEAVWKTVTKSFPKMASSYRTANVAVHCTYQGTDNTDIAFLSKWCMLRDEIEYIFANAANTLHDTATALGEAMNDYAGKDGAAAEALDKATEKLPDSVPGLKPTTLPYSGRYYASDDYYDPKVPEYEYSGTAPTIEDLQEKAKKADDKIYEASCAEMGGGWNPVTWLPRSWVEDSGDGTMTDYVTTIEKIDKIAKHNPSKFTTAISSLESIGKEGKPFTTFVQEIENAKDALHPDIWDGDAARDFRSNFLNAYEDIAATQLMVIGTLQGALEGYQKSLEETYVKYNEAMDAAIEACQAVIDGEDAASKSFETAVLTAAISYAGGLATKAGSVAISFALAGNGISIGSASMDVGGSEVEKIYTKLMESFDTAKAKVDELDDELSKSLKKDYNTVSNGRHDADADLDLPRPEFVDGSGNF